MTTTYNDKHPHCTRTVKLESKKVLVLGGKGFIGRHVAKQLKLLGHEVDVSTRRAQKAEREVQLRFHQPLNEVELTALVEQFDIIINTVGILRQRFRESYEQVHHYFVGDLANACAQTGVRLIHVSALGLENPVRSRFLTSKRRGEQALKRSLADWAIVRPSIIDGEGGYGAKWFRMLAKSPIHVAPANAKGLLCPIHVQDLAQAICALVNVDKLAQREFELGGKDVVDIFAYLTVLKGRKPLLKLTVPACCVRLCSHIFDFLHLTPLSFGHYELLQRNNVPASNGLIGLINKKPRELGLKRVPQQQKPSAAVA